MNHKETVKARNALLQGIVELIASDTTLQQLLVLQGGAAMHFIYGSPRFSNDVDCVAPELRSNKECIESALNKGILVDGRRVYPSIRYNQTGEHLKVKFALGDNQPSGKLEVYEQVAFEGSRANGFYSPIIVESAREIYADKIIATLARHIDRESIKPSDLFDLNYLHRVLNVGATTKEIIRKARSYRQQANLTRENLEGVVHSITNPANTEEFARSIAKTLPKDIREVAVFDESFFRGVSRHFIQYIDDF